MQLMFDAQLSTNRIALFKNHKSTMDFAQEMLDCPQHRFFAAEKPALDQNKLWRIKRRIWRRNFPELASTLVRTASSSSASGAMDSKMHNNGSPPKSSSAPSANADSAAALNASGLDGGMTVEALELKIEELRKKKREYFNMFKQLINTSTAGGTAEKQEQPVSAPGTPLGKKSTAEPPLASPQPAAVRSTLIRSSMPQMASISSVSSISTVGTVEDQKIPLGHSRTDSPPSHRTTPHSVSPATIPSQSRNTSPQMLSASAANVQAANSAGSFSYSRTSFSYSRNPPPPTSSSAAMEPQYDKPPPSYPPQSTQSFSQDSSRNYTRPVRPGYIAPGRKEDLHFGDKPSYPYPRSQQVPDRYSAPGPVAPLPPPADRFNDGPAPSLAPSRIPHPSASSTSRYSNYERMPYDDKRSQAYLPPKPDDRGRPLPPPSQDRYRGTAPLPHQSRFQPYPNNDGPQDRYRPPPNGDRYSGNRFSNNSTGPGQQSIPPPHTNPSGPRPYRPYRPPPGPGQVRPPRPDYVRNYTRPGKQPPPPPSSS